MAQMVTRRAHDNAVKIEGPPVMVIVADIRKVVVRPV